MSLGRIIRTTHNRIGRQHVQELLRHIPASDVVPERALEVVARIQVDRIGGLSVQLQLLNGCHDSRIAADAFLALPADGRLFVGLLESNTMKYIYYRYCTTCLLFCVRRRVTNI